MFGNWQQLGLGAVPPPFFAQPNMMYPLYPGAQEATATSGQSHQWNTGGQLPPMVFPSLNPLSVVASTASALEQQTNSAAIGSVSNILASGGCPPVPPLPSNPAPPKPPAPPTEEKPPLPPDPPPPDEDSKQKLTAKNPEEERRMEKLKQQAAQWQQQKKQIDDAAAQQQLQFQLQQQQQFHQMWLAAAQYMTPPTAADHLMAALPPSHPPLPPVTVPTLPQHTKPPSVPSVTPRSTAQSNIPVSATVQSNTPAAAAAAAASAASIIAAATITAGSVPNTAAIEKTIPKPSPVWNKPSNTPKDYAGGTSFKTDSSFNVEEQFRAVVKEEEEFERQYNDWKKQYDEWRIQNKDHPDRQQFKQYENQFLEIEAKMDIKRRDIQNRKRQIEVSRNSSNFQNTQHRFDTSYTRNRDTQYPKTNQHFLTGNGSASGVGGRVGGTAGAGSGGGVGTAGGGVWSGGGGGGRVGILGVGGGGSSGAGIPGFVRGSGAGILGSGGGAPGILGSGGAGGGGGGGWGRGVGILGGGGGTPWTGRGGLSGVGGNTGVGRGVGATGVGQGVGTGVAVGGGNTGIGRGIGAGVGGGTGVGRGGIDGSKGGAGNDRVKGGVGSDGVKGGVGGSDVVKGSSGGIETNNKQSVSKTTVGGSQVGEQAESSKSPIKNDSVKTSSIDTSKTLSSAPQSNFSNQDMNKDKNTSMSGTTNMDMGHSGANNRFGAPNRFDNSRNQFEGSQFTMGSGQGGRYGIRNEEPSHNVERQGMDKNFSFMDSDMRTQGPNQNTQYLGFPRGPPPDDRGFGRGPQGFNFNQGPRGGPRFNQGPPCGPGFNQGSPRGPPIQNRSMLDSSDNRMGPHESENFEPYGFAQRRRELSPNRKSSENQFGCFPARDGMAWGQEKSGMAKNQPMPTRSLDGKNDKIDQPLKESDEPSAKIARKDDDKGDGGAGNGQQWSKPHDLQDTDQSSNEQCNLKDGPQDFPNSKLPMKNNDNWGQFDPEQPPGDQGPNFRNRVSPHQTSSGQAQFERPPFKGMWGPQGQRTGPGFNANMQGGGPPPPPRMLINLRPEFNPRVCPPGGGSGPQYQDMMMRDGGGGPPFRGDKEGEQFGEGPGDNRPEGRMPPDCRPNSMGFPKNRDENMDFPGADEREMMAMGSGRRGRGGVMMGQRSGFPGRPNQQPRDCQDFPNMNRDDGNCRPDSNRNDAPPFNWSAEPRMNSKNQQDNWMNRERAQWDDNRCDFGNNNNNNNNKSNNGNKPWGHSQGSPAPPENRDMDPAFHKMSNPDFYDPMNRVNRLGDMNNRLYNADRCNRPPPSTMPPSRDYNHNRFNSPSSDQQFWNERDRNFPPKDFDIQRGNRHPNERFQQRDFLPPYGETIDYAHRPAREVFESDSDMARNKPPAVFDYGHKHANYLGRSEPSQDMDFQGNKNLAQDHVGGDRGRMFSENEHGPFQGNWLRDGDRQRNCDKEDMMRDMRNRKRDIDLRDRGRPVGHDNRERERLREREKFRDGQCDREAYLRGRERMDDEDKWSDRKHEERKFERDCRGRYNSPNRGYHNTEPPHIRDAFPKSQLPTQPEAKAEVVSADDLLCKPGRDKRPHQVVVIIRGLPGSGKTYVSKLIRDKETNNGGAAPRMLCMDDYFMVEVEKVQKDSESNKMIKKKVLQYEYEPDLEETYRQSILKNFKKTIDDGFFPFIIYDSVNEKVRHFEEFWSYAKSKGFQVYVATVHSDVSTCIKRNIHGRTKQDITKIHKNWEETPKHHIHLDIRCLLQDAAIPEVEMEDTSDEKTKKEPVSPQKGDPEEEDEPIGPVGYIKSKWEIDVGDQTGQVTDQVLDKLDGIRFGKRRRSASPIFSLDDYLQLDGYRTRQTVPGKKRVRWADMEERKQQLRRRELGFVVGQTQHDWDKITDDSYAERALNRTKYI